MKYILILMVVLVGCKPQKTGIINCKSYTTFLENPLPDCICRYWVDMKEFQDSCNKYSVGDTLPAFKK